MAFVSSFSGIPVIAPARALVSTRPASIRVPKQTRMSLVPLVNDVVIKASDTAMLMASREVDFGGYTGPAVGLLIIGIIIAVLTPPVKD